MTDNGERPLKFAKLDTSTGPASSLLARVSNFLPQLQAANKQLSENTVRLDGSLAKDDDDDGSDGCEDPPKSSLITIANDHEVTSQQAKSSSANNEGKSSSSEESEDDSDDNNNDDDDPSSNTPKAPTIEFKLAFGKVDENPAIEWLANKEENESEDDTPSEPGDYQKEDQKPPSGLVRGNLLVAGSMPNTKGKKHVGPLITEMD